MYEVHVGDKSETFENLNQVYGFLCGCRVFGKFGRDSNNLSFGGSPAKDAKPIQTLFRFRAPRVRSQHIGPAKGPFMKRKGFPS